MKESYLHFLWRMRCLPSRSFLSTENHEIEIIDFGEYNTHESGPDFLNGKILINGILWVGSIEFHLKSSDWYKHKHHTDAAYDNVILHVVWEMDGDVFCQDRKLVALKLSDYVYSDFSESQEKNREVALPCTFSLHEVGSYFIEKQKDTMIHQRLFRKCADLKINVSEGFSQVLYELLATAFGAKVNREPFWQLSRELPIKRLLKMKKNKRALEIYNYSGLSEVRNDNINQEGIKSFQWKKKGLLPNGFPERRVKQFAHFVQHFDFDFGFLDLNATDLLNYFMESFELIEKENTTFGPPESYSKSFRELIILNSFVPFLFWLGEKRGEDKWQSLAFDLLFLLPAESNHITKRMKQVGFQINSAYDSQALMELYKEMCSQKKCLNCSVGNEILKR